MAFNMCYKHRSLKATNKGNKRITQRSRSSEELRGSETQVRQGRNAGSDALISDDIADMALVTLVLVCPR